MNSLPGNDSSGSGSHSRRRNSRKIEPLAKAGSQNLSMRKASLITPSYPIYNNRDEGTPKTAYIKNETRSSNCLPFGTGKEKKEEEEKSLPLLEENNKTNKNEDITEKNEQSLEAFPTPEKLRQIKKLIKEKQNSNNCVLLNEDKINTFNKDSKSSTKAVIHKQSNISDSSDIVQLIAFN